MKKKISFPAELCYVLGIIFLTLGTTFMEKANLGMSTVVAPAYLLYLKLHQIFPNLTLGTVGYLLQGVMLLVMIPTLRRFRIGWLFSFATAVIFGFILDGFMILLAGIPIHTIWFRILWYSVGIVTCAIGVAFLFHTYLAPEVYDLCVKETTAKLQKPFGKVKLVYDYTSCAVAIILSFCFFGFGHFEGVKIGTVVCALVNGHLISFFGRIMDTHLQIKDALPLRKYFEAGQPA